MEPNFRVTIFVNSKETQIPDATTVQTMIELLGLGQKRVAVEVNKHLVTKSEWAATALKPGDRVEVVSFVGGG